jgi:predicted PurR-regulated permease PerM
MANPCYDRNMLGIDGRIARNTWTVFLVFLLIVSLYLIRQTLFIFIVALLFAYLLWPLVNFLSQRLPGRSKLPSLAIVYLLLLGVLVAVGVEVGSRIAVQAQALGSKVPELLSKLQQPVDVTRQGLGMKIVAEIQQQLATHSRDLILPVSNAIVSLLSHAEILVIIVLVPILSFYFLKDGKALVSSMVGQISASSRQLVNDIAEDLHLLLAQYMRAMVLLGLAASLTYATFFSVIGLPYGLLLGAIAFFFEFVPLVGPLTSAVIILLVAGLSGFGHLFWIILFLTAFRLFQDYVLSPLLVGNGIRLHPLLVIFGVLAGSQIAGIPGAFLSVPVLATLRIIYRQVWRRYPSAM